jgi:hypothetical protein
MISNTLNKCKTVNKVRAGFEYLSRSNFLHSGNGYEKRVEESILKVRRRKRLVQVLRLTIIPQKSRG